MGRGCLCLCFVSCRFTRKVLHGDSYKRLVPVRNTKIATKYNYNQPKRPSFGTTHRPSTGTIERAAQESSHITPTSTETVRAPSTATSSQYCADPAGSLPDSSQATQPSAHCRRTDPHHNTDTARTSGDTRHPLLGAPVIRRTWWTTKHASSLHGGREGSGTGGEGGRGDE